MLDPSVIEFVRDRVAIETEESEKWLKADLSKRAMELAARGMLASSTAALIAGERAEREHKLRSEKLLRLYLRAVSAWPPTAEGDHFEDACALLLPFCDADAFALWTSIETHTLTASMRSHGSLSTIKKNFDAAHRRERERLVSELRVLSANLIRPPFQGPEAPPSVVVTGNNNIVQAGIIGSTASIILDGDSRKSILEALEAVRKSIKEASALDGVTARDLGEVVNECNAEIEKADPNKIKIATQLDTISKTVQTTAALMPAWEFVRRALQLLGLS